MAEKGADLVTFHGYKTSAGNRDVQEWFKLLSESERDEAMDAIGYLQHEPIHLWVEPHFKKICDDISEIRYKAGVEKITYRIYGSFWPEGSRFSYMFLLGRGKKVKKDQGSKKLAVDRLKNLRSGRATTHEFEFESGTDQTVTPK